jgi:hypothetical protein
MRHSSGFTDLQKEKEIGKFMHKFEFVLNKNANTQIYQHRLFGFLEPCQALGAVHGLIL